MFNNKNTIIINGQKIKVQGNNITINNGTLSVDGVVVQDNLTGIVKVEFIGDLASLNTNGSASITGNVKGSVDAGGSITCGDVGGSVDAGGSVTCGKVNGNVDAGGSIRIMPK